MHSPQKIADLRTDLGIHSSREQIGFPVGILPGRQILHDESAVALVNGKHTRDVTGNQSEAAVRSHSISAKTRLTGASHSRVTLSCGSACQTQTALPLQLNEENVC